MSPGAGPPAPPSRVLPPSLPYWCQSALPIGCGSAGGKMSAGSGFESVGRVPPLPALGTPGLAPPDAPTWSTPCIHECSEQWNL